MQIVEDVSLRDEILGTIKHRKKCTFAYLQRKIARFEGNQTFAPVGNELTLFWVSISKEAFDVMASLLNNNEIKFETCSEMEYFLDGIVPELTICKKPSIPKRKAQWLPVHIVYIG